MIRFLFGLFIGYAVTRIMVNPYVQRHDIFVKKEKYLLHKIKQQKAQISVNMGNFLADNMPDASQEQILAMVRQIMNRKDDSNIQTPGT